MLRKIKKTKLDYKTRYIDVEFDEIDDEGNVDHNTRDSEGRRRKVHNDLIDVFKGISTHFIAICEQFTLGDLDKDPSLVDKFVLAGYSIGGSEEQEGVTLHGYRILETGMVINFVAPFVKFHPDHTNYTDANALAELIQNSFREIDAYLNHDKFAPDDQLDLFEEEKPKKRKRSKKENEQEELEYKEVGALNP